MSRLFGAALQGLGAGVAQFGQATGAMEMNRMRQEEEERRQIAVMQERERLLAERTAAAGGGSGGGGRGGNVFDLARAQEQLAFVSQEPAEADVARAAGVPVLKQFGAAPEDEPQVVGAAPGFDQLLQRKREELRSLREAIALGGDVSKLSDARLKDQRRGQLDRFEGGSAPAGEAAMIGQGKGVYGGDSNVTRNTVTGRAAVTPVGQAEVRRRDADAGLSGARAAAAGAAGGDDGPRPVTGVDLERAARAAERALASELGVPVRDLQQEIADRQRRGRMTEQETALLAEYRAALGRMQALGNPGRAAPPAPPAPAPIPELPPGARRIGTSGGKPVFETPDGRRFIQG